MKLQDIYIFKNVEGIYCLSQMLEYEIWELGYFINAATLCNFVLWYQCRDRLKSNFHIHLGIYKTLLRRFKRYIQIST